MLRISLILGCVLLFSCEQGEVKTDDQVDLKGQTVPMIIGEDVDGNVVRLADLEDKYLILHILDVDCNSCITSFKEVQTVVRNAKADLDIGYYALGLGLSKTEWLSFASREPNQGTMAYISSERADVVDSLEIRALPSIYLLNKKRLIKAGPISNADDLEDELLELLN